VGPGLALQGRPTTAHHSYVFPGELIGKVSSVLNYTTKPKIKTWTIVARSKHFSQANFKFCSKECENIDGILSTKCTWQNQTAICNPTVSRHYSFPLPWKWLQLPNFWNKSVLTTCVNKKIQNQKLCSIPGLENQKHFKTQYVAFSRRCNQQVIAWPAKQNKSFPGQRHDTLIVKQFVRFDVILYSIFHLIVSVLTVDTYTYTHMYTYIRICVLLGFQSLFRITQLVTSMGSS